VLGVDALELLATCGTNLDEPFRARQLTLVRIELGTPRDVARLPLGQLRAEDLRDDLALLYVLPKLGHHVRNPAGDERSDDDEMVGVRLDHRWC